MRYGLAGVRPPVLGVAWVSKRGRDRRDFRGAPLTVRIYKRKNGAGDRGRTGDVQLGNSPNRFSRKPRYHRLFAA